MSKFQELIYLEEKVKIINSLTDSQLAELRKIFGKETNDDMYDSFFKAIEIFKETEKIN